MELSEKPCLSLHLFHLQVKYFLIYQVFLRVLLSEMFCQLRQICTIIPSLNYFGDASGHSFGNQGNLVLSLNFVNSWSGACDFCRLRWVLHKMRIIISISHGKCIEYKMIFVNVIFYQNSTILGTQWVFPTLFLSLWQMPQRTTMSLWKAFKRVIFPILFSSSSCQGCWLEGWKCGNHLGQ